MQTFILHYNIISVQIAVEGVCYKCTLPSSRRMRTAPDPKLGILAGTTGLQRLGARFPLEFLAASRQLSRVARCMKVRIINFTKDDNPSSVYM